MKYKVGQKVRVRKDLEVGKIYDYCMFTLYMEDYKGKIVEILGVWDEIGCYRIKEDDGDYAWAEEMLEPVVTNFDKLKEILTIENFIGLGVCNNINGLRGVKTCSDISCDECREWLKQPYEEPKEEILDKAEKKYLKNVISPFRDSVTAITKKLCGNGKYISIHLHNEDINLPCFVGHTMYKGMRLEIPYKLEELGL